MPFFVIVTTAKIVIFPRFLSLADLIRLVIFFPFVHIISSAKRYTLSKNNSSLSPNSVAEAFVQSEIILKKGSIFGAEKTRYSLQWNDNDHEVEAFGPCQPNAAISYLMVRFFPTVATVLLSVSTHCCDTFFSMRVALFSNDMLQSYGRYDIICLTDINLLDRCDAIAECFVHLIFFLSVVVFIVHAVTFFLFSLNVANFLAWKMVRPVL